MVDVGPKPRLLRSTVGLRRVITFHSRLAAAREFGATTAATVELLPDKDRPERVTALAVADSDRLKDRRAAFATFTATTTGERPGEEGEGRCIICNSRLLMRGGGPTCRFSWLVVGDERQVRPLWFDYAAGAGTRERRTHMARPYKPGPKQFVFAVGDGNDQQVSVVDPQEAYVAFSAFFRDRDSDTYTISDEPSGQRLVLMPGQGVISRMKDADQPRSEHLQVDRGNRYLPSAMLFFENGYAGLDRFGQWFSDPADLDASPETRGAARAATITTEAAAIEEVARIWGDSGYVDPSDQYYVFFGSHGVDDDRADRAELLTLIEFLGLERVDAPAGAAGGEVWVRTDPRLDVECARWS